MSVSVLEITRVSPGVSKSKLIIVIISNTIINEYVNNKNKLFWVLTNVNLLLLTL